MKNRAKDCLKMIVFCVFVGLLFRYFFSIAVFILTGKYYSPGYCLDVTIKDGNYIVMVFMGLSAFCFTYAVYRVVRLIGIFIRKKIKED